MCLNFVSNSTWRALTAEFLGTMLFVFATSSFSCSWGDCAGVSPHISLATGLSYATVIQCSRKTSGGHQNPAVTVAYYLTDNINCCNAFGYILTQLVGGIVGAAIFYGLSAPTVQENLGTPSLATDVSAFQGFALELILTSLLVFVIFTVNLSNEKESSGYGIPLAIGLALAVCHYVGGPFSGCGVNPARVLGPAMISNTWANHWIYWIGPILGGSLAGVLYEVTLPPKERSRKESRNFHKRMTAILVILTLVTAFTCVAIAS